MKGIQAILHQVEAKYLRNHKVSFKPGDTVKVSVKVVEGEKERIQVFEGTVIGRAKSGIQETFRVRRVSYGVGIERVFPINSPMIEKIQVSKHGTARRAKLYYLREKSGKDARIQEERRAIEEMRTATAVPAPPPEQAQEASAAPSAEPAAAKAE
jgi:large subunit ribosomal protein L19